MNGRVRVMSWSDLASGLLKQPCHNINVVAMQPNLIETEMFGHVKDAFTGADTNKKGAIESANKGILFLDEIGELPRYLQSKFLRVMETGLFSRWIPAWIFR